MSRGWSSWIAVSIRSEMKRRRTKLISNLFLLAGLEIAKCLQFLMVPIKEFRGTVNFFLSKIILWEGKNRKANRRHGRVITGSFVIIIFSESNLNQHNSTKQLFSFPRPAYLFQTWEKESTSIIDWFNWHTGVLCYLCALCKSDMSVLH